MSGFGVNYYYYQENGEVKFFGLEDGFYNYLAKMNEWYEAGYIYAACGSAGIQVLDKNLKLLVITSYSIHYTKLYDKERLEAAGFLLKRPSRNF